MHGGAGNWSSLWSEVGRAGHLGRSPHTCRVRCAMFIVIKRGPSAGRPAGGMVLLRRKTIVIFVWLKTSPNCLR